MQRNMNSFHKRCELLAPKLLKALKNRGFTAYYCSSAGEAVEKALSLIPEGTTVSWGGSLTLQEIGLTERIHQGNYTVIDRDRAATTKERFELMRKALSCDTYLTSINAMSEDGVLVNIDNVGNRVAAIAFGPRNVIAIVGMNKVCKTVEDAETRARTYSAPLNALSASVEKTPCALTGTCGDCKSDECICAHIVKTRMCKRAGRIKVILVGESLGF